MFASPRLEANTPSLSACVPYNMLSRTFFSKVLSTAPFLIRLPLASIMPASMSCCFPPSWIIRSTTESSHAILTAFLKVRLSNFTPSSLMIALASLIKSPVLILPFSNLSRNALVSASINPVPVLGIQDTILPTERFITCLGLI